jgi:hypothetical protein
MSVEESGRISTIVASTSPASAAEIIVPTRAMDARILLVMLFISISVGPPVDRRHWIEAEVRGAVKRS